MQYRILLGEYSRDRGVDSGKEFENAGREWFRLSPCDPGLEKKAMGGTSG